MGSQKVAAKSVLFSRMAAGFADSFQRPLIASTGTKESEPLSRFRTQASRRDIATAYGFCLGQ
jgi:hypothetical protein